MAKKVKLPFKHKPTVRTFMAGIAKDNPIFCLVLGICSSLAVTNMVSNSIAMGLGVISVAIFSSVFISLLRKFIPARVRLAVYMLFVATSVICVDQVLKAYYPDISQRMGPYVGLIITNCIIMGRIEAFAMSNKPWLSFVDALGMGLGYTVVLVAISVVRELLGFGTLLGYQIMPGNFEKWVIMVTSPGAFIMLGIYIWIFRSFVKVGD